MNRNKKIQQWLVLGVVCAGFYQICLIHYGAVWYGWLLTMATVFGLILLPGYVLQKRFKANNANLTITRTAICGISCFALLSVAASWSGWHWIVLLPLLLAVWQAIQWIKQPPKAASKQFGFPFGIWLAFLLIYGICAADYAHASALGIVTPNQDFYYNVANVESFLIDFPPPQLRFAGMELRYHFLTELLAAGLCMATGISAFDMLGFFLPTVLFLGLLAVMWECGAVLYQNKPKQTAVWIAFVLLFGCASLHKMLFDGRSVFWNLSIRHLITNINGMILASLLMAAVVVLYEQLDRKQNDWKQVALVTASMLLLTFSKAPIAGVAAIALVCSSAVRMLFCKKVRLFVQSVAVFAVFAAVYIVYFSKNAQGAVELSITGTLYKSYFANFLTVLQQQNPMVWKLSLLPFMLLQTVLFSPAVVVLYLGGVWWDIKYLAKIPVWRIFANAMAVGGMMAFFLFDHEAMSQMYFAFAAVFFMGLLAVQNLFDCLKWLSNVRKPIAVGIKCVLVALCAVSVLTGVFQYGYLFKNNVPILISPMQATERFPSKTPVTAQEENALQWLKQHSSKNDVFVTNRIHSGSNLEGFSFIHTALSGRSCYLETSKFAASNTGASGEEVLRRLNVIEQIYSEQTEWKDLCRQEGIQWVVYAKNAAGDWSCPDGIPAFENEDIKIFDVSK